MKSKALAAASAALLSLSLMAGTPVLAQEGEMIDDAVNAQLVALGFLPSDWVLTQEQVLQLQNVLSSNDSDDEKQAQVRQIVGID